MIQLRDPSIDAFAALQCLERDLELSDQHPLRALAGIHLTTAHLQYEEGEFLYCIESCQKGYGYLTGKAIRDGGEVLSFPAQKFYMEEIL